MTTVVLEPDSLVSSSGASASSGTVHGALSDDADSTYVRGTVPGGSVSVGLQTTSLGSNRVRGVRVRARYSRDAAGGAAPTCQLSLRGGSSSGYYGGPGGGLGPGNAGTAATMSVGTLQSTALSPVQEFLSGLMTTAPGGSTWTQALLDSLQLKAQWQPSSDNHWIRLYDVDVEVDSNAQPTVTTPVVTGLSSTRPAWSADYDDADGDPQTRLQVKVFTAAVAAGSGFNPDTSPAVWNSGTLVGAATSGTVGSALLNGAAYKLFWRAAQDWVDATGLWWSSWAGSAAFTIAADPPVAPAVTVEQQLQLPVYRHVVKVTASPSTVAAVALTDVTVTVERGDRLPAGRGVVANWAPPNVAAGGAERGNTDGFAVSDAADTLTFVPTVLVPADGVAAYGAVRWHAAGASAGQLEVGSVDSSQDRLDWRFPVGAGPHVVSCWARTVTGSVAAQWALLWLAADGFTPLGSAVVSVTLTATAQRLTASGSPPAGAVHAVGLLINTGSATADIDVTRAGFGAGTAPVDRVPGQGGPLVWSPLRGLLPAAVSSAGQVVPVVDQELAAGRPALYRATVTGTLPSTSNQITSAPAYGAPVYAPPPGRALLRDPRALASALVVNVAPGDSDDTPEDASTFHPAGRDGDPVVVRDWLGGMDGAAELAVLSDSDLFRLYELLSAGRALLLQWTEGGVSYIRPVPPSKTRVRPGYHKLPVKWTGQARPS